MPPEPAASAAINTPVSRGTEDPCTQAFSLGNDFMQLQRATIMMVDDQPIMMDVIQTFLEITGCHKFIKIDHADQAVDKVREHSPDLLLLGVTMSQLSGFDILELLRTDPAFSDLPVIILLTSPTDVTTRLWALDLGASEFLSKPIDPIELALRVRNTLAAKAYQDEVLQFDRLTGLPTRGLFLDRVEWAIARAKREQSKLALLHVTFGEFKDVLEEFGAIAGDDVLKQLATRLNAGLRASDALSHDSSDDENRTDVFQLGSAEFSVLLPTIRSVVGTSAVGQRIAAAMSKPLSVDGTEVYLKPNIGIAAFPDDADDARSLIELAKAASRLAYDRDGGGLRFFSSTLNQAASQWLRMEADLRRTISAGELGLLYQPKVDVTNNAIIGAEALMRWPRQDGVIVSPSEFISVAEETGLILQMEEWVLREACRQAMQWRNDGADIKIAVNISAPQFFEAKLAPLVQSILEETGMVPGMLTLEITEKTVIDRMRQAVEILGDLRAIGVEISIDDFGTGYSSLNYLKRFQVDEVKLDRTLIADVATSRKDRALVSAVTHLAHQFGSKVCAEGVESANQLKIMQKIKCDRYQGYLFSRPLDPKTFLAKYLEQ